VNYKLFLVLVFFVFTNISAQNTDSQEIEKDSITTPFKKGRWLLGMFGTIGSSTTENTSSSTKTVSNHYSIGIGSGKFVIDRLNIGFNVNLNREDIQNDTSEDRIVENLFIGPRITYYISKNKIGSLYFGLTPGFTIYREETQLNQGDILVDYIYKGNGFGLISAFGYTYVIHDKIGLDVGLNWSTNWININEEPTDVENLTDVNFVISDLTFSFGFKILLDSKSN